MPTLAEQQTALEAQLAEVRRKQHAALNAQEVADEEFLVPIRKRLRGYHPHSCNADEVALVVRAVLDEYGFAPKPAGGGK
jgi:hypothetical protein